MGSDDPPTHPRAAQRLDITLVQYTWSSNSKLSSKLQNHNRSTLGYLYSSLLVSTRQLTDIRGLAVSSVF